MKSSNRTPENIALAHELYEHGYSRRHIGERFGVGESTIRQWMMTEDEYSEHKTNAVAWMRKNRLIVNARLRERNQKLTREQKDAINLRNRERYRNDPKVKAGMARLAEKYRATAQGAISALVRRLALGHSNRQVAIWTKECEALTGMTREKFTKEYNAEGTFDHIMPLCAFDLTNPEHFVRACHPSNLRIIPRKDNEIKGARYPEGFDVMTLRWARTESALDAARKLIAVRLDRLKRNNEPCPPAVHGG